MELDKSKSQIKEADAAISSQKVGSTAPAAGLVRRRTPPYPQPRTHGHLTCERPGCDTAPQQTQAPHPARPPCSSPASSSIAPASIRTHPFTPSTLPLPHPSLPPQAEIEKLNHIINEADQERIRQKKEYDIVVNERDILGTQLIRRNDELALLYEKIKIQQSTLSKGQIQYRDRLNEIRVLKIKLADLKRELHILKSSVANIDVLKREVHQLGRELLQVGWSLEVYCTTRVARLVLVPGCNHGPVFQVGPTGANVSHGVCASMATSRSHGVRPSSSLSLLNRGNRSVPQRVGASLSLPSLPTPSRPYLPQLVFLQTSSVVPRVPLLWQFHHPVGAHSACQYLRVRRSLPIPVRTPCPTPAGAHQGQGAERGAGEPAQRAPLAQAGGLRPRHLRDDPEDPDAAEAAHHQDGGGGGKGPAHPGEGEAVHGAQEHPGEAAGAGGGGAAQHIPGRKETPGVQVAGLRLVTACRVCGRACSAFGLLRFVDTWVCSCCKRQVSCGVYEGSSAG